MLAVAVDLSLYLFVSPACFLLGSYFFCGRSPFAAASQQHYLFVVAVVASFVAIVASFFTPKLVHFSLPFWLADVYPHAWLQKHWQMLVGVYLFGVCWCLSYLLLGLYEVKKITDEAKSILLPHFFSTTEATENNDSWKNLAEDLNLRHVCFKTSQKLSSPVTWGYLSPVIILPSCYKNWPQARLQRVVLHELAHVARKDWLVKFFVQVLCSFMWYLWPIWLIARKVNWYAELACDDEVINRLNCRAEYAQDLVDIASNSKDSGFSLAFHQGSHLYLRVRSVLDGCRSRERCHVLTRSFITIAALVVAVAASSLHATVAVKPFLQSNKVLNTYPLILPQQFSGIEIENSKKLTTKENQASESETPELLNNYAAMLRYRRSEEMVVLAEPVTDAKSLDLFTSKPELPRQLAGYPRVTFKGYLPIKMVTPQYPRKALKRAIEGKVITQFDVNERGAVENVRIIYAQPKKVFDQSVIRALEQFKFMPLQFGGENIKTKNVSETFIFNLRHL